MFHVLLLKPAFTLIVAMVLLFTLPCCGQDYFKALENEGQNLESVAPPIPPENAKKSPPFNPAPQTIPQPVRQTIPRVADNIQSNGPVVNAQTKLVRDYHPNQMESSRILASVAGEPIFVGDLIGDINMQISLVAPDAPEYAKPKIRAQLMKQLLPMAIEQKLIYIDSVRSLPDPKAVAAVRADITAQYDKLQLPRMIEQLKVSSREELDQKLRSFGGSLRRNRENWVNNQITGIFVSQMMTEEKTITRLQMLDEYNRTKKDYSFPAKVRWEELMIRYDRAGGESQAWRLIAELGNQVIKGGSLSELAKQHSHGFSAKKGGQYDWTERGSLANKEIEKLIFDSPVNSLSEIIKSAQGYHIIRVIERTQAGYVPFEEMQQKIKKQIQANRKKAALDDYIAKLRKEIPVEIYDADLAKAFNDKIK